MIRFLAMAAAILLTTCCCWAAGPSPLDDDKKTQETPAAGATPEAKPAPVESPAAGNSRIGKLIPGQTRNTASQLGQDPLTAQEKAARMLRRSVSIGAIAGRGALAGISHWRNDPEEWGQGAEGYGKRFGASQARFIMRDAIQLGFDVALKTDPRYHVCGCSGFGPRTWNAMKQVLITRKDHGGSFPNIPLWASSFGANVIAEHTFMPERFNTPGQTIRRSGQFLAIRAAGNIAREFQPEFLRAFGLKKK